MIYIVVFQSFQISGFKPQQSFMLLSINFINTSLFDENRPTKWCPVFRSLGFVCFQKLPYSFWIPWNASWLRKSAVLEYIIIKILLYGGVGCLSAIALKVNSVLLFLITLNNADIHTDVLQLHKQSTELNTLNFAKYHNLLLKGQKW